MLSYSLTSRTIVLSADWLIAAIIWEMSLEPWSGRASTEEAGGRPR